MSSPGFASPGALPRYAPDLPLLPVHQDIRVELDFAAQAALVQVSTRLRATRAEARRVVFDLVDASALEVEGLEGRWSYDGSRLELVWEEGAPVGAEREATVRYRVQQPTTGLHFGEADGPRWAATDHETERARHWLACVDHPIVRPTVEIRLVVPGGLSAISVGQELGSTFLADGRVEHAWRLDHACPSYLLCFVAGELVQAEGGEHQGRLIRFFAPPPWTSQDLVRTFGRTAEFLDWTTTRLGRPLPWPKYYQFAAPGIGGAMENISLVSWDDAWMCDERWHAETGWLVDLVNVHEMAHTWFGDEVVCRDFAQSWLKESWATYIESVWIEEHWGAEAMQAWLTVGLRNYLDEARSRYRRPIATRRFDSSWDLFDRHLYPGGAVRLHLLRRELGDPVFWPAVRDYLERFAGGVVETADLRRVMEQHSGQNLARFFDQWFESPGHPKLEVKTAWKAEEGLFTVHLRQTQCDPTAGVGLFTFPLELAVLSEDGSWQRHRLDVQHERASLTLRGKPVQLILDPDASLPHELIDWDPGDELLLAAMRGPSVRGRLQAFEAACALGRPALLAALGPVWRAESLWLVRRILAAMLGESRFARAAGLLSELVLEEQDPRVMGPLMSACVSHRDPRVAAALVAWLALPDRPYGACQQALASLGAQRGLVHHPLLLTHLGIESPWDRVRQGALTGLGASREAAALEHIRPWIAQGSLPVRKAAVLALAEAARWAGRGARQRVAEELVDRLRDPDAALRKAAAQALASLGESSAASAIEAATRSITEQDRPAMLRQAAGLRTGDGGVAGLEKRVEALEARIRKLEERCH